MYCGIQRHLCCLRVYSMDMHASGQEVHPDHVSRAVPCHAWDTCGGSCVSVAARPGVCAHSAHTHSAFYALAGSSRSMHAQDAVHRADTLVAPGNQWVDTLVPIGNPHAPDMDVKNSRKGCV